MTTGSSPPPGQLPLHSPGRATINIDLASAHVWPRLWLVTGCAVCSPSSAPHFCPVLCPGLASGHKQRVPGTSLDHRELGSLLIQSPLPTTNIHASQARAVPDLANNPHIKIHQTSCHYLSALTDKGNTGAVSKTIFFIGSSL